MDFIKARIKSKTIIVNFITMLSGIIAVLMSNQETIAQVLTGKTGSIVLTGIFVLNYLTQDFLRMITSAPMGETNKNISKIVMEAIAIFAILGILVILLIKLGG